MIGRTVERNIEIQDAGRSDGDQAEERPIRARKPPLMAELTLWEGADVSGAPRAMLLEVLSCMGVFTMPKGAAAYWDCLHMLSGYGVGSRPVEHVISGCLLGRYREDDAGEKVPGWCVACGAYARRMTILRRHIRYECDASEVCEVCCEKSVFFIKQDEVTFKACNNCMRTANMLYMS